MPRLAPLKETGQDDNNFACERQWNESSQDFRADCLYRRGRERRARGGLDGAPSFADGERSSAVVPARCAERRQRNAAALSYASKSWGDPHFRINKRFLYKHDFRRSMATPGADRAKVAKSLPLFASSNQTTNALLRNEPDEERF